jgi:probable HAF family extracellular repeat protein
MGSRTRSAALAAAALAVTLVAGPGGPASPAAATAVPGVVGAPAAFRPAIRVTRLPGLDGPAGGARATDVNERGVVVGESVAADGRTTAVRWDGATPTDLTAGAAGTVTRAVAVNDRGAVLGVTGGFASYATLWEDGEATPLPPTDSAAVAVDLNDRGEALYNAYIVAPVSFGGFLWRDGTVIPAPPAGEGLPEFVGFDLNERGVAVGVPEFGPLPFTWRPGEAPRPLALPDGADGGFPIALNDRGDVAGRVTVPGPAPATRVVRWRDGRPRDLGDLGGGEATIPDMAAGGGSPINRRGDVVGASSTASGDHHAFLWRDGHMTDLGTLGGPSSWATAVNDSGQVVGASLTAEGEAHAFAWQDGRMVDLTALAGGGQHTDVTDINDRGQVVGHVEGPDGPVAHRWDLPARL